MKKAVTEQKRESEKELVQLMIAIYCRGKKHGGEALCPHCSKLLSYAHEKLLRCPHMKTKNFCSQCPTPCYRPEEREKIKKVMCYSGPRMLFYHPILAIRHMLELKRRSAS